MKEQNSDTMSAWVKQVLGFVGLNKVDLIHVEGLAYKADEVVAKASAKSMKEIIE